MNTAYRMNRDHVAMMNCPGEFTFMRQVEEQIFMRLGRRVLLDTVCIMDREKLHWMMKPENQPSDEQVSKALNDILRLD